MIQKQIILDTNILIFAFQKNQDTYRGIYDKDKYKSEIVEKIINKIKINKNYEIIILQKITNETKWVCKNKLFNNHRLFFNEERLKELTNNYPGGNHTHKDINKISKWNNKIKNQNQKFDEDDMLIYLKAQEYNKVLIITDNDTHFRKCAKIYKKENKNAKEIKILNIYESLKYFKV